MAGFASDLCRAYRNFTFEDSGTWSDIDVEVRPVTGFRRWLRPQVTLICDHDEPFRPFPADTALPMFEWGVNWLISQRLTHLLLLHAAVLERDGCALVLPATPGSGKSTLAAALSLSGWRLLSDEFGAYSPELKAFIPVLKPVALKNESIGVIAGFSPGAPLGPSYEKTRKGTVAHLAATTDAALRFHEPAPPALIVLPRWHAASGIDVQALPSEQAFTALAFNAFNYQECGEAGFDAAVHISTSCPAFKLLYHSFDEVLPALDRLWGEHAAGRGRAHQP